MRLESRVSSIKTAQKESAIFRIIGPLFQEAVRENVALDGVYVTQVRLSQGKSHCYIYCYVPQGKTHFDAMLPDLKLYKPSMRKALATELNARYTADLVFVFDDQIAMAMRMESLLDAVKSRDAELEPLLDTTSDMTSE